jgi:hypothetical protein
MDIDLTQLPNLNIGAVALSPIIVALVQLARHFGLKVEWAPWLAALLALAAYAGVMLLEQQPDLLQPAALILNAVVIFLTTTGFYHQVKNAVT